MYLRTSKPNKNREHGRTFKKFISPIRRFWEKTSGDVQPHVEPTTPMGDCLNRLSLGDNWRNHRENIIMTYNVKTGIGKTTKNWLVTWGIPIVAVLVNNWANWVPTEYTTTLAPIMGAIAYFIKNYLKNK